MSNLPEAKKAPDVSISEKLTDFIQNNRKIIFIVAAGLVLALVGSIITLTVRDNLRMNAIAQVEDFGRRFENLRINLEGSEVDALVAELSVFAPRNSGYAGARAHMILGHIHAERQDWSAAEAAFTAGARVGARTYLSPVSLFNAAAAAEEQGDIQGAIDLFTQSAAARDLFPAASRAQFQVGRLEESRNNTDAAIQAYRTLINTWPNDAGWADLAQSRIIALTISR